MVSFCIGLVGCKKTENPIKYPYGIFPDSTINLEDINSPYDDFNVSLYHLNGNIIMVFSSNRGSTGGQFDLVQGMISFTFDQTNGVFGLGTDNTNDLFLSTLLKTANTGRNDLGPYSLFSTADGYEYWILSSENTSGDLDLFFLKNRPAFGTSLPVISGPSPIKLLNSQYDDAYISLNQDKDTVYFCSNPSGNFDIYMNRKPANTDLTTWFNSGYSFSANIESLNTSSDDKCPFVYRKVLVFASNRPGGLGNFDLYYSVFKDGKWGEPVNLGPEINTSYDEYRPVIGFSSDFENYYLIFSSNRPGGKGNYDLYFRGLTLPSE